MATANATETIDIAKWEYPTDPTPEQENELDKKYKDLEEESDIKVLVKKGIKSIARFKKTPIAKAICGVVSLKNNIIQSLGTNRFSEVIESDIKASEENTPLGVIIERDKDILVIKNGDLGEGMDNSLNDSEDLEDQPTISFDCLARLVGLVDRDDSPKVKEVANRLVAGKLEILDYSLDTTKPLSKAEKAQLKKYENAADKNKVSPPIPPVGFTLMDNQWHRAATVVFRDTVKQKHYILGQDEGTYFGCQLSGKPFKLAEAFLDLIPEEIRKLPGIKRQGEWFAVPVAEKDVPNLLDLAATFDDIAFPVESDDSNVHSLTSNDGRIGKDGRIYTLGGSVTHNEHESLDLEDRWYTFYRNTAIKSVSAEANVD
jgi:hypothetical protein